MTLHPTSEATESALTHGNRTVGNGQLDADDGMDDPVQAVRRLLEAHRQDKQLVLLQDFPDPDALSSAWAYKLIAASYKIDCDIVYAGTLSHQENIAPGAADRSARPPLDECCR
jgi:hypothetical protein